MQIQDLSATGKEIMLIKVKVSIYLCELLLIIVVIFADIIV